MGAFAGAVLLAVAALGASAVPAAAAAPTGWLHTKGSQILDSNNKAHVLRATSWFGMETANCAPHGLWTINLDDGMAQIASFGFNAIRLPFSNECLDPASSPNSISYAVNPRLEGLSTLKLMDAVVASAKAHGLSIILDRHRPDSAAQSELWYTSRYSEQRWIADWTMLAKRYAKDPTVVGADLHNEPHGAACWGCKDPKRDWAAAATRAGNAVLAVNPKLLVIVEGVEKQASPTTTTWWGGGLGDARKHPVKLKVSHQLVYSTHDYPASVFAQPWFAAKTYPRNLAAVWKANWGYLQQDGTTPVLLGEFGTKLQTASDKQWLTALVDYVRVNKMSFAYWSFNPNSGDTGGLVKDDWRTPERAKLDLLRPILGTQTPFTPKVRTAAPSTSAAEQPTRDPATAPTTAPTTAAEPSPSPTASGTPTTASGTVGGTTADWRPQSSWPGGYVAELTLTSTAARQGWTVSWPDTEATSAVNAWGMTCTTDAGTIRCTGADWGRDLPPGQTVRVGVQVATPGAPPSAPGLTLS